MSEPGIPSKSARLAEFFNRLVQAPLATTFDEAFDVLSATLNQVEDELSGVPFDPPNWKIDGRMYPPQPDKEKLTERPGARAFRTVGNLILLGDNGAIEVQDLRGQVVFSKSGADGKTIPSAGESS
jgi:hypothetical protein